MSLKIILEIVLGILKFPDQLLKIIRLFRKTPQEVHEEIMKKVAAEAAKFEESGRPTWDR